LSLKISDEQWRTLTPLAQEMVVVAALTGLRWGELIALRMEEDVDFRRNKLHITHAFYRRIPQTPKTAQSIRSVDMCPTVLSLLQGRKTREGLVFTADGLGPMGAGNWDKTAVARRPIAGWHSSADHVTRSAPPVRLAPHRRGQTPEVCRGTGGALLGRIHAGSIRVAI
jgi:integrase